MLTIDEILNLVNERLAQVAVGRTPKGLYEPIRYVLSMGGKRIRPTLMLMAYNLFREDPERILTCACALETYHNYTLLHDDLMDNADKRRGKQTVHVRWNENQAILSGDTMLLIAYQMMGVCPDNKLRQVLQLFTQTAMEICDGQQLDMEFETRTDVKEDEYIEMIRLKTSVLLACAMKIGAILAGASEEDADNLYHFGEKIGLAFQLQDDYLDVYGDEKVFGKAIGGDITSNKKTFLLINAYLHANELQRKELEKWISMEKFDRKLKIQAVTKLYNELRIDILVKEKINQYFKESEKYLAAINVPNARKKELKNYTYRMMQRKK